MNYEKNYFQNIFIINSAFILCIIIFANNISQNRFTYQQLFIS